MRLNLFLPSLKRPKEDVDTNPPSLIIRAARRVLPDSWFSEPATGNPGGIRRMLKRMGPTWLSSPARRMLQTVCMILFLILFFYVCWPYGSQEYAETMQAKEFVEAELFLALDPLLSISTALAAKTWVWSLTWAGIMLLICVIFPRGFCGYICPLGTLIDIFDWTIGKRVTLFNTKHGGWWVHLKYYILLGTLVAALFGILLSGFVAATSVITRGMLFVFAPLQQGLLKGWYLVPPMNFEHYVSIALFFVVLLLSFLQPRFWCRYFCPTGALFSVANLFRVSERKVESTCIHCNRCVEICPFDAIKADFTTRTADCTFCQTCGGVCPTHSIKFVSRWDTVSLKPENEPTINETPLSRRGFLAGTLSGLAAVVGIRTVFGANLGTSIRSGIKPVRSGVKPPNSVLPVRPPGSVPEQKFLQMCIRCGECFKVCPNSVLQPMGFEQGLEGLWTPWVVANWSGCEPNCNNCGQVCPTGAIRALPIKEKRVARMGLAIVNKQTCLPYAGHEACRMCVDECAAADYNAIEFIRVGSEVDKEGMPIEDTGYLAPVVLADKCVGCGLCQTRCHSINVKEKHLLTETAILVEAGPGKEDRMMSGSYLSLREEERRKKREIQERLLEQNGVSDDYLPDFLK